MTLNELHAKVNEAIEAGHGDSIVLAILHGDSSGQVIVDAGEHASKEDVLEWLSSHGDDYGIDWNPENMSEAGYFNLFGDCEYGFGV